MSANAGDVKKWIEELKKRGIDEFHFRDLPEDLRKMGTLRRASFLKKIKELKKINDVILWKVQ